MAITALDPAFDVDRDENAAFTTAQLHYSIAADNFFNVLLLATAFPST